jgi:hypothetical protein
VPDEAGNATSERVGVAVAPQLIDAPARSAAYCSCACAGPASAGPFCRCPGGFSCVVFDDGLEPGASPTSYCSSNEQRPLRLDECDSSLGNCDDRR